MSTKVAASSRLRKHKTTEFKVSKNVKYKKRRINSLILLVILLVLFSAGDQNRTGGSNPPLNAFISSFSLSLFLTLFFVFRTSLPFSVAT